MLDAHLAGEMMIRGRDLDESIEADAFMRDCHVGPSR